MRIPALLLLLWLPLAFADSGGKSLIMTFRQNCTMVPSTADLAILSKLQKVHTEIARRDLEFEFVKPEILRQKEINEAELTLAKSKCLSKQMANVIGGDVTSRKMESVPENPSHLSQLSIYQGMLSRELERLEGSDDCIGLVKKERLSCMIETQKKISQIQASLNAVGFYLDVHRVAVQRNPNLSLDEAGKIAEKKFQKDFDYLKNLPSPGEEDEESDGDVIQNPPSLSADDLVPSVGVK